MGKTHHLAWGRRPKADAQRPKSTRMGREICIAVVVCAVAALCWRLGSREAPDDASVPAPTWTVLDTECGIWHARDFLSEAEVVRMLALVNQTGGWESSATGGAQYRVPRGQRTGAFSQAVQSDALVHRIEQRIAQSSGIPVHPHEDMLSMAAMTTMGAAPRSGNFVPFGLHHDSDTRPNRARTVLVYLSSVPRGGRTVFPLCGGKPGQAGKRQLLEEFSQQLHGVWGGATEGYSRQASFDIKMEHPFNGLLADSCRGEVGVAVQPVRGEAIMFDAMVSRSTGGLGPEPQMRTWHAGCNVLEGVKIILQKFKELEMSKRSTVDAHVNQGQTHAYIHS